MINIIFKHRTTPVSAKSYNVIRHRKTVSKTLAGIESTKAICYNKQRWNIIVYADIQ